MLSKGQLVEQGKPAIFMQKYNDNRQLEMTYKDLSQRCLEMDKGQGVNGNGKFI